MAKGALYFRLKDEKTGKWTYKKATYKSFSSWTKEESMAKVHQLLGIEGEE